MRDYVDRLVAPYFEAVAEWYATLHVGQVGGALQAIIDRRLGDPFFGIGLNPGHQLHLDEWVNSPVWRDSTVQLRSGMVHAGRHHPGDRDRRTSPPTSRTASRSLTGRCGPRSRPRYPEAWARIQARRAFMRNVLGIELHPDVLPLSNIPACLPPFLLRPDRVLAMAG